MCSATNHHSLSVFPLRSSIPLENAGARACTASEGQTVRNIHRSLQNDGAKSPVHVSADAHFSQAITGTPANLACCR